MDTVLLFLVMHCILRIFDSVYFHEYKSLILYRENGLQEQSIQISFHLLHAFILAFFSLFEVSGWFGLIAVILLMFELGLVAYHFMAVNPSEGFNPLQKSLHLACVAVVVLNSSYWFPLLWANFIDVDSMFNFTHEFTGINLGVLGIAFLSCVLGVKQLARVFLFLNNNKLTTNHINTLDDQAQAFSSASFNILMLWEGSAINITLLETLINQGHEVTLYGTEKNIFSLKVQGKVRLVTDLAYIADHEIIHVIYKCEPPNIEGVLSLSRIWKNRQRYSKKWSKRLNQSNQVLSELSQLMNRMHRKPELILQESSINIYHPLNASQSSHSSLTLESTIESGQQDYWQTVENSIFEFAEIYQCRVATMRMGDILSTRGGVFLKARWLVDFGVSIQWGDSEGWFSWVHEQDVIRAILFVLENPYIGGAIDVCAPKPITYGELTCAFEDSWHTWFNLSLSDRWLPGFLSVKQQPVFNRPLIEPGVLLEHQFEFLYPDISNAMTDLAPYHHAGEPLISERGGRRR